MSETLFIYGVDTIEGKQIVWDKKFTHTLVVIFLQLNCN
jgi:hypothetical protein